MRRFAAVGICTLSILGIGCGRTQGGGAAQAPPAAGPGNGLPEVSAFLAQHHEFGTAASFKAEPDWADGKRQTVVLDSGKVFMFYTKGGSVVTVYELGPGSTRSLLWGESQ